MPAKPKTLGEQTVSSSPDEPIRPSELMAQLKLLNANLERDIRSRASWKLALRNGLIGAVAGLIGTSILVALIVHFVKPLNQIIELRPALERLANQQPGNGERSGN
ncbi:MAG: hypothetical protein ACYC96_09340 [Fimbriimonadaceae bacterium]